MNIRTFSLWCTFWNANLVLVFVPIAIGMQSWSLFQSQSLKADASWSDKVWMLRDQLIHTAPNLLQILISGMAASYYTLDFITMMFNVHPLTPLVKLWYTIHHIFCFIGLTAPVFYEPNAFDTTLAFIGFWMGEVSNPPRCIVDLLQAQIDLANDSVPSSERPVKYIPIMGVPRSVRVLDSVMASLQHAHLVSFMIFRVLGTHYFIKVCYPYASMQVTNITGGVTLLLSIMAAVVMLQGGTATKDNLAPIVGDAVAKEAELTVEQTRGGKSKSVSTASSASSGSGSGSSKKKKNGGGSSSSKKKKAN